MEVRRLGAHPSNVEREHRAHLVRGRLHAVIHDHRYARHDLERLVRPVGGTPGPALGQRRRVEVVVVWRVEEREPTVGDLGGECHVFRTLGGEQDRQVGPERLHNGA
jgi:hypothetical protein